VELIKIEVIEQKQRVGGRELYEFLGYEKAHWKRWYQKNILNNDFAIEKEDYRGFTLMVNGNETMEFQFSIDFAKKLSMMARTEKGEEARKYFIECEKKLKASLPTTYIEALQALIVKEQEKEQLQIERNEVIRTKAWIGDKKVATALNTASQKSKEVKKLKNYIGECEDYATILAVERIYKEGDFKWRELKKYCTANELEVKTAPDKRFGKVKSYPAKAWLDLYYIDLSEIF